ncbi:hypothetical protein BUE80_DR000796 [Diplocarpon rosae]|nr:hypothetical protein BUE80_DR000796 [Diplocarpon rosae]
MSSTTTTTTTDIQSFECLNSTLSEHKIKVIDFAPGTYVRSNTGSSSAGETVRKRTLGQRIQALVWNPKAKYTRRGKLTLWMMEKEAARVG